MNAASTILDPHGATPATRTSDRSSRSGPVTRGRTVDEARTMLPDAAPEMIVSYRDEGREPPIGGGHAGPITIDFAA